MQLNKTLIAGNLTRDPELKFTAKGTAICRIGLAINRDWKNDAGEKQTEVTFLDVDLWGKSGEAVAKYLKKGQPIFVEGRLKLDTWEKDGKKFSRLGVVADNFQFVGSKADSASKPASQPASAPASAPAKPDDGDDVPF